MSTRTSKLQHVSLNICQRILLFARKHMVLVIAAFAAAVTMILVPPDEAYLGYIDWNTLGCLFCVLAVANAFRFLGVFDRLAHIVIEHLTNSRSVAMALVITTGALSMFATNDLTLIVMLPLSAIVLARAGWSRLIALVFVMEGLAANLCGMILPFGNPQNLYLYSYYSLELFEFLQVMLPLFAVSTMLIAGLTWLFASNVIDAPATMEAVTEKSFDSRRLLAYILLLALAIFAVMHAVAAYVSVIVTAAVLFFADRRALKAVDYLLLLTFVCFFVFAGNLARVSLISDWLSDLVASYGLVISTGLSQIISNVPAAVLLSHFTGDWQPLLAGVNIGGAGTLVASLASLIVLQNFTNVRREFPEIADDSHMSTGYFLKLFSIFNVAFLAVLLLVAYIFHLG